MLFSMGVIKVMITDMKVHKAVGITTWTIQIWSFLEG